MSRVPSHKTIDSAPKADLDSNEVAVDSVAYVLLKIERFGVLQLLLNAQEHVPLRTHVQLVFTRGAANHA